jgi:hypothetical protein
MTGRDFVTAPLVFLVGAAFAIVCVIVRVWDWWERRREGRRTA